MGPRLSTGGNVHVALGHPDGDVASMGPRLSTGGNGIAARAGLSTLPALQWGPVSRRGGTSWAPGPARGNWKKLQWGPVSRRGGTEQPAGCSPDAGRRFNGAPSLDGGEPPRRRCSAPPMPQLQWGPVSRRGGTDRQGGRQR